MKRQRLLIISLCSLCLFFVFYFIDSVIGQENIIETRPDSICIKEEDVNGSGQYPYNFRLIDNCLAAGGSLFNPVSKSNTDEKVCDYIRYLKKIGISSLMLLHVPLKKDLLTSRLEDCCKKEGIELIKMRMNIL